MKRIGLAHAGNHPGDTGVRDTCRRGITRDLEIPTLETSPFDLGRTVYGFFPSPPEATTQSVIDTYKAIGQHGDVVLLQQNIPWETFAASAEAAIAGHHRYPQPVHPGPSERAGSHLRGRPTQRIEPA